MLVLLIVGTMDTGAMVGVTTAITIERLAPAGGRVARATRVVVVIAGAVLLSRAARQV